MTATAYHDRSLRMETTLARDVRICARSMDTTDCEFIRTAVRRYITELTGIPYSKDATR